MADETPLIDTTETLVTEAQRASAEARDAFDRAAHKQADRATANLQEITRLNQETFDALVLSSRVTAKAAEAMGAQLFAFAKRTYEESVAAAKEAMHARSMGEFVEKQAAHQKVVLEDGLAEMGRLNDLLSGAVLDAVAPISERLQAAARLGRG